VDERLTPDELRGLLGAFALGAVDPDEHEQVEEFVLDDREARAELHQLEHAVAWLGHASPRPSAQSWDALRLEMDRDLATPGTVTSMAAFESHRNRRGWRQLIAVAAAAVILVGTAIGVARVIEKDSGPTTRTVALHAPSGRTAVEASIAANGDGSIHTSNLPAAPAGHVYQLWAQPTSTAPMHSAGILGRSPAGHHVHIPPGSVRIAISVEPDGGSPAPTTDPVAVSDVL
jgi:Anti-sigma-K factor rskA.